MLLLCYHCSVAGESSRLKTVCFGMHLLCIRMHLYASVCLHTYPKCMIYISCTEKTSKSENGANQHCCAVPACLLCLLACACFACLLCLLCLLCFFQSTILQPAIYLYCRLQDPFLHHLKGAGLARNPPLQPSSPSRLKTYENQ